MNNFSAVLADASGDGWDHMGGWGGGSMWLWGVAMMVLFAVLIVWLVRAGVSSAPSAPVTLASGDRTERAFQILAERYASGEVTTDEYRERVDELR